MRGRDHRHDHLMPVMWKGDCGTDSGILHRIQLMGDDNEPKTYCMKASIRFIRRTFNDYDGKMCLRCDWRV